MTRIGPSRLHVGAGAAAVTPHHLATQAALDVIGDGGNAVDAAIAANAVLGMVLPDTCGIGGDLFTIVHTPGQDRPEVLNASGRAGTGADAAAMRDAGRTRIEHSDPEAVTVPGCVDGWMALVDRHGSKPLSDVLAPAIALGRRGFPTSVELAAALERAAPVLAALPQASSLYPNGSAPAPMATLTRPDLAFTLESIGIGGRSAFYEGSVATAISEATGGILTIDDLSSNSPDWVEPAGIDVFGLEAWTAPPNSQGYLALAACWILERLAPPADIGDPALHHAAIEAYRAVAWERDDLVADPRHAPRQPDWLLDPDRLARRSTLISTNRVTEWPGTGGAPGGTAYLCVIDGAGMGVSLIQSNFTGLGGLIAPVGAGFLLHNRGAGFNLDPGHPNELSPRKRPLHTLAPTLWTRDGELRLLLGTRGGHQQPQYLTQVAASLFVAGLDPQAAQHTPRWHIAGAGDDAGSAVTVESRMPEDVVAGLTSLGHPVSIGPPSAAGWGPVSLITIDGTVRRAVADPRVSTSAANGAG